MEHDYLDFIVAFLSHYDEKGIEDKFDRERNKMVTSPEVLSLVEQARALAPEKLGKLQAANAMRALDDNAREAAITDNPKVIDTRAMFSKKIQDNGGARGLLLQLVDLIENGRTDEGMELLADARKFRDAEAGLDVFSQPEKKNDM